MNKRKPESKRPVIRLLSSSETPSAGWVLIQENSCYPEYTPAMNWYPNQEQRVDTEDPEKVYVYVPADDKNRYENEVEVEATEPKKVLKKTSKKVRVISPPPPSPTTPVSIIEPEPEDAPWPGEVPWISVAAHPRKIKTVSAEKLVEPWISTDIPFSSTLQNLFNLEDKEEILIERGVQLKCYQKEVPFLALVELIDGKILGKSAADWKMSEVRHADKGFTVIGLEKFLPPKK